MDVGKSSPLKAAPFPLGRSTEQHSKAALVPTGLAALVSLCSFFSLKGQSFISEEPVIFRESSIRKQKCYASLTLGVNQGIKFFLNPDMFLSAPDWDVTSCLGSNLDLAWNLEP